MHRGRQGDAMRRLIAAAAAVAVLALGALAATGATAAGTTSASYGWCSTTRSAWSRAGTSGWAACAPGRPPSFDVQPSRSGPPKAIVKATVARRDAATSCAATPPARSSPSRWSASTTWTASRAPRASGWPTADVSRCARPRARSRRTWSTTCCAGPRASGCGCSWPPWAPGWRAGPTTSRPCCAAPSPACARPEDPADPGRPEPHDQAVHRRRGHGGHAAGVAPRAT